MSEEKIYLSLKEYFGYSEFRDGQKEIVEAILNNKDVLAVMPTGSGKSICYQLPALMRSGVAIIISPLISLMKDQVEELNQKGIAAAFFCGNQDFEYQKEIMDKILHKEIKLLYIAPERLLSAFFLNFASRFPIQMIAVDEAHCVSQWGQDFRPSYLKIAEFINLLNYRPQVCAFTATATPRVKKDIYKMLELRSPFMITTGFDRPNLSYNVINSSDKNSSLIKILGKFRNESGIIYCSTRKKVEEVCNILQKRGFSATRYHAGLDKEERAINQEDFISGNVMTIVATNAFGMGINKPDVRYVIHYNMPKDIESYYQETGRAGRDGAPAHCYLLYSKGDYFTDLYILKKSFSDGEVSEEILKNNLNKLKEMNNLCNSEYCLRHSILRYFGENSPIFCNNCSSCKKIEKQSDITLSSMKIISCIYRAYQNKEYVSKDSLNKILHGSRDTAIISKGFNNLSTYGILSDEPKKKTDFIIDDLIDRDYIGETNSETPLLYLKKKSAEILKGKAKLYVKLPITEAPYSNSTNIKHAKNPMLYKKLIRLRAEIANDENIPTIMVLPDESIRQISELKPTNIDELEQIQGIGKLRSRKYGRAFIKCIKNFKNKTD